MFMLITYDINTESPEGRRRLREVAKVCVNYGQRVQNSVFECLLDSAQMTRVKHALESIINPKCDSLRFYNLGNHYQERICHIGAKPTYDPEAPMIL